MGAKGNALLFTYTKPCHGTFVLTIDDEESKNEISRLREMEKGKITTSSEKGKPPESVKMTSTSYQDVWKKEI